MNQFSFFDAPVVATAQPAALAPRDGDVKRIVQHKQGALRELKEGKPTGREFRLIEIHDGSIFSEFTDTSERVPVDATMYQNWIALGFRNGSLIEVPA